MDTLTLRDAMLQTHRHATTRDALVQYTLTVLYLAATLAPTDDGATFMSACLVQPCAADNPLRVAQWRGQWFATMNPVNR